MIKRKRYEPVLKYIESYWDKIIFEPGPWRPASPGNSLMKIGEIKLPYRGIAPNHDYFWHVQFYWDTYFTLLGLTRSGRNRVAQEVVTNELELFKRFGLIPSHNTLLSKGRSQPPLLTSMIWEIYDHNKSVSPDWLSVAMRIAEAEYRDVWNSGRRYQPNLGLSQYNPTYIPSRMVNYESGWDISTRFIIGGIVMVPVELNCMLYQYENDFLRYAKLMKQKEGVLYWKYRLAQRQEAIVRYFWNKKEGYFCDYNLLLKKPTSFRTLAGFYPLWCKAATKSQAAKVVEWLTFFECKYGLATTQPTKAIRRQWDYPNGWPNLHFIVIKGLLNYGYKDEATRIAKKWLDLNLKVFEETGQLWEKYDVVSGAIGKRGHYPTQPGFGWTNGVFLWLIDELGD